ncbi:MAG: hypothetical protein NTV86_18980 [Planctomycetota bacterium]|nr:hypothetical protein [Planctomycetota bacterium]
MPMGRFRRLHPGWILLSALLPATWTPAASPGTRPSPGPPPRHYDAASTPPAPPRQGADWTPPASTVPKALLDATAAVFKAGLADPRGCEFRYLFIRQHDHTDLTSGWLLPGADREGRRYGIGWDGLIYPVVPHKPADLAAEVDLRIRLSRSQNRTECPLVEQNEEPTTGLLPQQSLADLGYVCLLMRVGEGKMAGDMFTAWKAEAGMKEDWPAEKLRDHLAACWDHRLQCQVRQGFLRDDFWTVLRRAAERDALTSALPPRDAPRENIPYYQQIVSQVRAATKNGPVQRVMEVGPARFPDPHNRIAAMVRDLETVRSFRNWDMKAPVSDHEPLLDALLAEGRPAIGPLLECIEKDTRLSRGGSYGMGQIYIPGVSLAARAVLEELLGPGFHADADLDRPADCSRYVAMAREYLKAHPEIPATSRPAKAQTPDTAPGPKEAPEPSDYELLANEEDWGDGWTRAASNLCGASAAGVEEYWTPRWPKAAPPDNPLWRTRRQAVSDLMTKRIRQLLHPKYPATAPGEPVVELKLPEDIARSFDPPLNACKIAHCLNVWSPGEASRNLLGEVARELMALHSHRTNGQLNYMEAIAAATDQRVALGDPAALTDYVAWLRGLPQKVLLADVAWYLEPLISHNKAKPVTEAADWFFRDPRSPLLAKDKDGRLQLNGALLWQPRLLTLEAYRRYVLAALADERPTEDLLDGQGSVPRMSAPRVCDWYAQQLAEVVAMPEFDPAANETDRQKTIAACIDRLKRYGPYLTAPTFGIAMVFEDIVNLELPPLGRPATPEDVRQGRAIFALAGPEPKRVVDVEALPRRFTWAPKPAEPQGSSDPAPDPHAFRLLREVHTNPNSVPALGGGLVLQKNTQRVYQVEEVFRDGRWQRFCGVAGPGLLDCVPAERVTFPMPGARDLTGGFQTALTVSRPPHDTPDQESSADSDAVLRPGQAAALTLWLHNQTACDQSLPRELRRDDKAGSVALAPGLALRAWYLPPGVAGLLRECPWWAWEEEAHWFETPTEPLGVLKPDPASTQTLRPGQTIKAFSIDLQNLVDLSRPGVYRLRVLFHDKPLGFARGHTHAVTIRITNK